MKRAPALMTSFMTRPTLDCDCTVIERNMRRAYMKANYKSFGRDRGIGYCFDEDACGEAECSAVPKPYTTLH